MTRLRFVLALSLCATAASGCSSCKRSNDPPDASLPATLELAAGVPVRPWVMTESRSGSVAVPSPCKLQSRPRFRQFNGEPVVFAAADGETRTLAVASVPSSGSLPPSRGIVDTAPEDAGVVRDFPWLDVHAPPVLAASRGRWMALLPQAEAFSPTVRLWLWRESAPIAVLAEGDGLTAIDARCEGDLCGVLTTRAGAVATGGATLWTGAWSDPADRWTRNDLAGGIVPADAKAVSIARFSGPRDLIVAFDSGGSVLFTRLGPSGLESGGKVAKDDALLDVAVTSTTSIALSMRGRADAEGCAPNPAIVVRAPDREPIVIPLTALPLAGYARSVGAGVVVAWIQPVDCKTDRRVVNAVVFDSRGVPMGSMVSVADADGFAMASAGEDVRLWLRDRAGVTQLDARCPIPAGP